MLTPYEYIFMTPEDLGTEVYLANCEVCGLPVTDGGWGLLLCKEDDGTRWTKITKDVDYLRMMVASQPHFAGHVDIPGDKFPLKRAGWPDDWAED